jgi:hypothetical protein
MTDEVHGRQFGVAHVPIKYTLGRGVPEALGDRVLAAVTAAFLSSGGAGNGYGVVHCEFEVDDIGIEADARWTMLGTFVDLHLELVRTDYMISVALVNGEEEETNLPRRESPRYQIQ